MDLFWKKKVIVSYILACFVLIMHNSSPSRYGRNLSLGGIEAFNDSYELFFRLTFVKLAVPLFFIISGCLFFRNCEGIKNVFLKMKSRITTLLVPFLLWNIIDMMFQIITSYSFCSRFFTGRKPFDLDVLNILQSIFFAKSNGPFWFIFALIIFVIISPLIFYSLKNKYVSFSVLIILLFLHFNNINLALKSFINTDSIIYYYLGCIIGKYYFDIFSNKINKSKIYVCLILFLICEIFSILKVFEIIDIIKYFDTIFYLIFALSFWYLCDLFIEKIPQADFFNSSFYVYAMHINIESVLAVVIWLVLPKNDYFSIINFILTVLITLTIIYYFSILLKKYVPKAYNLLGGGR